MTQADNILAIDICVCTFRRVHLADTLRSLSTLDLQPDWKIRIIVADNDETPSARELAEQTARARALALTYIHAPARNISVARNACLDAVTAPFFAFIDDDEIATPAWLEALFAKMHATQADVVLGPVQAVYGADAPAWMVQGDFHSTRPVFVKGEIRTGYSCNVLLRSLSHAVQGLSFREEFGRTGGEDTVFFDAVYRAGGRFAYAPEALVTEAVPPARAQFSWLLRRSFRSGQTHGVLLLERSANNVLARGGHIVAAFAKMLFCYAAIATTVALRRSARSRYWILRGILHAGVVFRLLGKRELVQYG